MRFSKQFLVVLASAGLLLLGACSSGQQTASSGSSPAASPSNSIGKMEQPSSTQSGRSLTPISHTGDAQMTLNLPANPLPQGKNMLMLSVMDTKGQPVVAKEVQVAMTMTDKEMAMMGMKGMGEGSAKTTVKPAASPGQFEIGTSFPFGGNWDLKVDVKDVKPPASAAFKVPVKQ